MDKGRVTGGHAYEVWALVNDLGFYLRHFIDIPGRKTCVPAWDGDRRQWIFVSDFRTREYKDEVCEEYLAWVAASSPDGFAHGEVAEHWSRLAPHILAKDELWAELVKDTEPLRKKEADIFGAAYQGVLEVLAEKYLAPRVKPAKR